MSPDMINLLIKSFWETCYMVFAGSVPTAADNLAALKKWVFDEKKYTFQELIDALKANFQGYDKLYQDFSTFRKFGNDDPYVDAIYKEMGMAKKAKGIAFSLPVSDVAGLVLTEAPKDPE